MIKCGKAQIWQLQTALRWKIPALRRHRIQMVLLRESGMAQPAIAAAMGVSLKPKASGGRQRENTAVTEETALLARFAKAAGAGEMLNIHDRKAAYEQAIGPPNQQQHDL